MNNMHTITYCEALRESLIGEMKRDPSVFLYGIGVPDHKAIFGSVAGIMDMFGSDRCFDTPIAEDSMVGFGLGAAISGLRPVHHHIRVDFLLLAMNQLSNMVSNYFYITGGQLNVPIVIRAVVGRGWGQGCQHSKSVQSIFAHLPGLKVIMPTTPADAKGMLTSAIRDNNPVICLEHRWLYWQEGEVPVGEYCIPLGQPNKIRDGQDLTLVSTSWMNVEAKKAAEILSQHHGVEIEIIDPRNVSSFDDSMLVDSVAKTRRCIVADNDWVYCGFASELASIIYEKCFDVLESPIPRIGFTHTPCPAVRFMENEFYPNAIRLIRTVEEMLDLPESDLSDEDFYSHENRFKGPF